MSQGMYSQPGKYSIGQRIPSLRSQEKIALRQIPLLQWDLSWCQPKAWEEIYDEIWMVCLLQNFAPDFMLDYIWVTIEMDSIILH